MRKQYSVNSKKSLEENIRNILPEMYHDFISHKKEVFSNPLDNSILHKMRITGKPLRYIMEIEDKAFGEEYEKCSEEIKDMIGLMGDIHDCDVMVPEIISHLKEIQVSNQKHSSPDDKVSTQILVDLAKELGDRREALYLQMCNKLEEWEKSDFKSRLAASMQM